MLNGIVLLNCFLSLAASLFNFETFLSSAMGSFYGDIPYYVNGIPGFLFTQKKFCTSYWSASSLADFGAFFGSASGVQCDNTLFNNGTYGGA
jgi:hypothetical protein